MRTIRPLTASDRPAVERIARECGAFTDEEIDVCLELVEQTLRGSPEYEIALADDAGQPAAFLIFGLDPIGQGVWEVYWIVTHPALQHRGVGTALLDWLRARLDRTDARMIVLETSGQPAYAAQRRFYERNGYREVARIADFYRPGDDLVTYRRDLSPLEAPRRGRVAEAAR